MPWFHWTQHTRGSWMPDRDLGYFDRGKGLRPADPVRASLYRRQMTDSGSFLTPEAQRVVIEAVLEACRHRGWRCGGIGSDAHHTHSAIGVPMEVERGVIRRCLKRNASIRLNQRFGTQDWWTDGGDVKRIRDRKHLTHLRETYFPKHDGWYWHPVTGWRPPLRSR